MSDAPEQSSEPQQESQVDEAAQTFDAEYVAKLRKENAAARLKAKENADAAKRLAEIEEASKSESEKIADRIAKAESEVASVPAKVSAALREHLVELHGIEADDAELFLTASDPETLLKQVSRLVGQSGKRNKNRVPREGTNQSSSGDDSMREFARSLFAGE